MAKLYKVRKKCMICGGVFYPKYAGSLYCEECKNRRKPEPEKKAVKKLIVKKPAVKKTIKKAAPKKVPKSSAVSKTKKTASKQRKTKR
jgi:hypothetical protein